MTDVVSTHGGEENFDGFAGTYFPHKVLQVLDIYLIRGFNCKDRRKLRNYMTSTTDSMIPISKYASKR